ncbi:MAG: outer membrane beta-barrel protein [Sulfuricaulis sp.]|uniref:outer membrane beta-barrel protein n=1 Tax=Sulfuricaulis sp. TaxID=2003553 RepID=UPI0025FE56DA|nr:outer membrane beta-barrel protein [Sulfuricaulis sp.]MCR4346517.1 outer membrane beta-barrel protein [Sulfuricaulis sp.]
MQSFTIGGVASKRLVLIVLLAGAVSAVQAGDFAYGLGYTATRSDNITRAPSNERSDTVHSYLAGFAYQERTSEVVARILALAEYHDYQNDTFSDEGVYNLNSSLLWTISPQRFTWTVEDVYQETQITNTTADTPSNRTNVNVFSTGPDFYLRFNPVHTLALGARAGNVSTGRANADNDRFSSSASWLYQANSTSVYSVNFQLLDVNYDDSTLNNDYTRHDVFARAEYRPSRSQYVIDLGTSKISRDRGQDLDGTLARLSWVRQLTTESSFGMSASGEFSDTGADVLSASTATASSTGLPVSTSTSQTSDVVTSDVYYAKRGSIFYNRRGSSFAIDSSAYTQELDFETTPQDRKENGVRLQLDFFYSGATTVTLFTEQARIQYQNFVREDTDRDSGLRLGYRVNRTVSLGLEGRRTDRTSTISVVEYEENRVFLSVLYSSSPLFTPISTR